MTPNRQPNPHQYQREKNEFMADRTLCIRRVPEQLWLSLHHNALSQRHTLRDYVIHMLENGLLNVEQLLPSSEQVEFSGQSETNAGDAGVG